MSDKYDLGILIVWRREDYTCSDFIHFGHLSQHRRFSTYKVGDYVEGTVLYKILSSS